MTTMTELLGKCDDRFEGVRAALVVGSERSAEYGQAIYDALAS